jgi:hypothetical protein
MAMNQMMLLMKYKQMARSCILESILKKLLKKMKSINVPQAVARGNPQSRRQAQEARAREGGDPDGGHKQGIYKEDSNKEQVNKHAKAPNPDKEGAIEEAAVRNTNRDKAL